MSRARRALVAGLAAGLAGVAIAAAAPGASAGPGPLISCPMLLECGRISVPLDHADPGPGRLALVVSRLRPRPGIPSAGTLLFLTGGPGQAGIARDSAETMYRLRALSRNREVISVDLRGTGRSGALICPTLQGPVEGGEGGLDAAIAACAGLLGPARRHYDTGQVVGDLEVVRQSLGIDRWAIGGVSYGTYVATRYARAHPDRVERLLLDSLVPPEGVSATGADSLAASRRIVDRACPRRSCGRISGALAADVRRLDARLAHGAVPATAVRRDGTPTRARVGGPGRRSALYEAFLMGDVDAISRAAFPAAVRAALSGDGTLLARIVRQGQSRGAAEHPTRQSAATQIASLCEDSALPWRNDTPVEARRRAIDAAASAASVATPQAPFSPFSVAELSPATLCLAWPEGPEAQPDAAPLPAVPTLVLAGGADIRTPLEGAYRLASRSPGAEVVVVPARGHSILSRELECVETAVRRFFSDLPAGRPCARLRPERTPLPVPPSSLAGFRAGLADRRPAKVILSALRATLGDVVPSIAFGRVGVTRALGTGLRGGTLDTTVRSFGSVVDLTLVLDDFEYVPGVRVSGTMEVATSDGGSSSPKGRLTVVSPLGRAAVRLGKSGIRVRLPGSPAVSARTLALLGSLPAT